MTETREESRRILLSVFEAINKFRLGLEPLRKEEIVPVFDHATMEELERFGEDLSAIADGLFTLSNCTAYALRAKARPSKDY